MDSMANEHLVRFEEALQSWRDERFVSRDQVRALAMFALYIVNLSDYHGWRYDGHSYKVGVAFNTLVIKATFNGAPVVSFVSGRTFVNCVRIFFRRLEEDTVEWRDDKFRG